MKKILIKKNDMVIVTKGKDKGKTGKVLKILPEKDGAIVEKLNFCKEFIRRDQSKNVQGGVMEKEAPIHLSNLMFYCGECAQGTRIRTTNLEDGSKMRVCGKCDISLDKQK